MSDDLMDDEDNPGPEDDLDKFKRWIKNSREAFRAQRQREDEDLAFQVPENQWDAGAREARRGGNVNGVASQARPTLSISQIHQPLQLVQNQAEAADLGINVHPISEKAKKETAEVLQGIQRRIERDSNAEQARLWGFDRAKKAGLGAYLVATQWDDLSGNGWDQEIVIKRLLYQSMCGWDPDAQEMDFSDGNYCWIGGLVTRDTFKREWKDKKLALASDAEFDDMTTGDAEWFQGSGRDKKILVITLWYKVHDFETLTEGEGKNKRTRKRDKITLRCAKLVSNDVLEDEETNGHLLPLIPVIGTELQPFGTERRWVGMIANAKDAQKYFNVAASSSVEGMLMEPKNPWTAVEGQLEGREAIWQQANTKNFAYLEYKPVSIAGTPAPPPQRTQVDTSRMQLSMMAMSEARNMVQATTHVHAPSLGILTGKEKSGKALLAAQGESDAATSNYLANLANISLRYEARVVLDLIPFIYDRPGRVCRIVTGEDKDKVVMLNAPFTEGEDGYPVAAAEGAKNAKMYDLREADGYSVSTTIGKSFQSRLQQGAEQIGELLQAAPQLLPIIGDLYFQYQDIPSAPEIAKRLGKWREMQFPGLGEGEEGQAPTPDQQAAKIQAMGQQMQTLQAQLQQAMQMIETEKVKTDARLAETKLKEEAAILRQQMGDQTKLDAARIAAQSKGNDEVAQARDHAHESSEAARERTHETQEHREEMAHEVGLAVIKGSQAKEQVREQAALKPIPDKKPNGGANR